MNDTYDVVLLVEQALSAADAIRVRSLHEGLDDPVKYHLLLPIEDAAARIEAAMGGLSGGDLMGTPNLVGPGVDVSEVRRDCEERSDADLLTSLNAMASAGADAVGEVVTGPPVDALAAKVAEVDGREAIILTRPHIVAEFFHLDWTSRAERKIGVPILHLLEHESFGEQAGGGEGVNGF